MTRHGVDAFLERSEALLAEPAPALAVCAWCSHPLDDGSPSGEFCGERCAAYWRAGCDWYPEERCACRTCDPDGAHHIGFTRYERRAYSALDPFTRTWLDAVRASPARGLFQVMPGVHRRMENYLAQAHAVPEIHVDTSAAERAMVNVQRWVDRHVADVDEVSRFALDHFRQRWFLGVDVAAEGRSTIAAARYDEAGNLVIETDLSGWTDMGYISTEGEFSWTNAYDEPGGLRDLSHDLPPAPLLPTARRAWLGAEPTMTIYDEIHEWVNYQAWIPTEVWAAAAEPERTQRWVGRKPNRRRRKRRR